MPMVINANISRGADQSWKKTYSAITIKKRSNANKFFSMQLRHISETCVCFCVCACLPKWRLCWNEVVCACAVNCKNSMNCAWLNQFTWCSPYATPILCFCCLCSLNSPPFHVRLIILLWSLQTFVYIRSWRKFACEFFENRHAKSTSKEEKYH